MFWVCLLHVCCRSLITILVRSLYLVDALFLLVVVGVNQLIVDSYSLTCIRSAVNNHSGCRTLSRVFFSVLIRLFAARLAAVSKLYCDYTVVVQPLR